jgi:hypothetical protein
MSLSTFDVVLSVAVDPVVGVPPKYDAPTLSGDETLMGFSFVVVTVGCSWWLVVVVALRS